MKVPLLDLSRQYKGIRSEVLREVKKVLDSQHYILGPNVSSLESEVAAYCGVSYAVGVASGTDALLLSLMAAGVGAGDKVVTTAFTFFATAGSIARLGARPVFADIHPLTFNIDPNSLETLLKNGAKGVKAIIPVHLYGQCADMKPINELASKYGLTVIEDAAQSIGAAYSGKKAGSLGDMGCFSFYPTKNLGGAGDGGMVTTNDQRLAEKLKTLRVHGSSKRYYHDIVGANSRLDEVQAAILRVKMKYLDKWSEGRVKNAGRYGRLFKKSGLEDFVTTPVVREGNISVFNQYVIRARDRDNLRRHLSEAAVGTEVYYPLPLHLQGCFKGLGYKKGDLPVSERAADEALALPIYPELRAAEQGYVVSSIIEFYGLRH